MIPTTMKRVKLLRTLKFISLTVGGSYTKGSTRVGDQLWASARRITMCGRCM